MGGDATAARRLDRFFQKLNAGPDAPYAYLGNEPTLGVPWLYDWLGRPARTTDVVHRALLDLYAPTPNGMPGNDDGGAMSAWWVLGAIGLYPAVPGSDLLALNGPLFPHATISLPSGRLQIDADGVGNRSRYIQSARLDGIALDRSWLNFSSISRGRHRLLLRMGANSRSRWATRETFSAPVAQSQPTGDGGHGCRSRRPSSFLDRSDAVHRQAVHGGPRAGSDRRGVGTLGPLLSRPGTVMRPAVDGRARACSVSRPRIHPAPIPPRRSALGPLAGAPEPRPRREHVRARSRSGGRRWPLIVEAILNGSVFAQKAATICGAPLPGYYFDNSVRPLQTATGPGFRGTAEQLQQAMDARARSGGGTVWLARAAVIYVGNHHKPPPSAPARSRRRAARDDRPARAA